MSGEYDYVHGLAVSGFEETAKGQGAAVASHSKGHLEAARWS